MSTTWTLLKHPDEKLRQVSEPVVSFDPNLLVLAQAMCAFMYKNGGVGLAAPQLGVFKRVIVWDASKGRNSHRVMVNPEVVRSRGLCKSREGCLSIPGAAGTVMRGDRVDVKWQDLDGKEHQQMFRDLAGCIIQHEIDHLNGVLFIDKRIRK